MIPRIRQLISLCVTVCVQRWLVVDAFFPASLAANMKQYHRQLRHSRSSPLGAIKVIFSDIDGSLLHYPKQNELKQLIDDDGEDYEILKLPPSATGMRGIISAETLRRCQEIRKKGVKLVLISGMRTSTLLGRLPYLPRADAYCTESGGRIFYPTDPLPELYDTDDSSTDTDSPFPFRQATPLEYDGANPEDLKPFGLVEDMVWRQRMEDVKAAGMEGYPGNEVSSNRCDNIHDDDEYEECLIDYENMFGFPLEEEVIPIGDRTGALWDFARHLEIERGLVLDTTSYSTCFRVNKKHQVSDSSSFGSLFEGSISIPSSLDVSTNLGCIDVYPVASGKRNCCEYLANEWHVIMGQESVCICDDDNDMEMALACSRAFIPSLTSGSVEEAVKEQTDKFTQTFEPGRIDSTRATDAALSLISEDLDNNG